MAGGTGNGGVCVDGLMSVWIPSCTVVSVTVKDGFVSF